MSHLLNVPRREAEAGRWFDATSPVMAEIIRNKAPKFLISGPLGTGKTSAALNRIWMCCIRYPGCRWILLRSVRKWMTNSVLVTWEEKVVCPSDLVPDRTQRSNRIEYRFKNGSIVAVAGLDDPVAIRSAEYDGAFILEATECSRDAVEEVSGRLRYGRMPYQQLIMDCNPSSPSHWLKQEIDSNRLPCIETTHRDNPFLFSQITQDWTPRGRAYLDRLKKDLTGVRRLRLLEGRWVQAEGVVYTDWNPATHVVQPFTIPAHWRRWHAVDFGFTNPLVWQFWAEDEDGRLYLYREIYQTKRLVRDVADWVNRLIRINGDTRPEAIVTDHDPEAQEHIRQVLGITPTPADKSDRVGGIQDVADRLRVQADGKPRLFVVANSLEHAISEDLRSVGKPTRTEMEFDSYVWNPNLAHGEQPLKENDHGMDACRYLCKHLGKKAALGRFEGYGVPEPDNSLPEDTWR